MKDDEYSIHIERSKAIDGLYLYKILDYIYPASSDEQVREYMYKNYKIKNIVIT